MVLIVEKCQHEHKQSVANTKFEPDGQIVFSSAPEIINRWIFFVLCSFLVNCDEETNPVLSEIICRFSVGSRN